MDLNSSVSITSSSSTLGGETNNNHDSLYRRSVTVNKKHAHCAMFIKQKFEEEEKYLMYMYPDVISSNIYARGMEQLKGVMHAARAGTKDTLGGELAFIHLVPSNSRIIESVSSPISITSPLSPATPTPKLKKFSSFDKINDLKMEMEKRENLICTFEDCGSLLFLLIMPVEFTEMIHMDLTKEVIELLNFIFPSLESVVFDAEQHYKLNHIFNRFFRLIFKPENRIKTFLSSFTKGFTKQNLSFDVQHSLHDELLSLESTITVTNSFEKALQVHVVGSCLIHSGILVASHMSSELTKHITRYVSFMKLTNRCADQSELVIIEEVYCPYHKNAFNLLEKQMSQRIPHILIILSQRSELLCILLQSSNNDHSEMINKMRDCLERIHSSNVWNIVEESVIDLSLEKKDLSEKKDDNESQLRSLTSATEGPYNVLLHYISHNEREGTIILPTSLSPKPSSLLSIELRFIKTIEIIREVLLSKKHEEKSNVVVEYGIHAEDSESFDKMIGYWIIGRMTNNDEFYVCYEDSVPQNVAELMHRLGTRLYYN